ncbi:uracil-DNA glycosylase [Chryseobacterium sp. A301]
MNSWNTLLESLESDAQYQELRSALDLEYEKATVYPKKEHLFRALEITPFEEVKVVIVGQDPYHGVGQANGLSFSVDENVKLPPSLRNIFKELQSDLGIERVSGDLQPWARQGVLLLNSVLSVREGSPGSHQFLGWEKYTDQFLSHLSKNKDRVIFVLWGAQAQKKLPLIDSTKHLVLQSAHPSPLSAYRGFFGSKVFSKINADLEARGLAPMDWL